MTDRITPLDLEYQPGVPQRRSIVAGSKPLAFLNRAGIPTVYLFGPSGPDHEEMTFTLIQGSNAPPVNGKYLGTVEFRGGQAVLHAFYAKAK